MTVRLKYIARPVRRMVDPATWPQSEVAHYSIPNLDAGGAAIEDTGEIGSAKLAVRQDDSLVSKLNPHKPRVFEVTHRAALASSEFIVLRDPIIDARFLRYFLSSDPAVHHLVARMRSVTRSHQRATEADVGDLPMPAVDHETSARIADFLDRETQRIDALVDAKRRMIDLLEEKLTASVIRAVTRGFKPTRLTKASGVAWIGDVPADWSVEPIGARFQLQLGKMLNREAAEGPNQLPYVRNVNVQWWRVDLSDLATMSFSETEQVKFQLEPGDLLVCEGGEVGRAAIWKGELERCFFQKAIHRLRPRYADDPQFLAYVLYAAASMEVFRIEGNQSTIVHLTGEQLRAHRIAFPPPSEQREISAFLDEAHRKTRAAVAALRSQLTLLAEYRQALITKAVTGQLDEATLKGSKPADEVVGV